LLVTVPALMYHDVTPRGHEDASGFPGGDAARYKLTSEQFERHLAAIAGAADVPPLFTFDDGGASAEAIADALERQGWRGYFFITTSRINQAGFVAAHAVRRLDARGHVIGSHSHTHPLRMARCSRPRLVDEWRQSVARLSDLIGCQVAAASVPGGEYSDEVARAADESGIDLLFTSQPTLQLRVVGNVRVHGRFPVLASTSAETVAALSAGTVIPRAIWAARWRARRFAKYALGDVYLRLRGQWLGASKDVRWGDELSSTSKDPA
jgi:peptidoglycan/xylan/chitin deacetylase (PgdA/CDA1 family)